MPRKAWNVRSGHHRRVAAAGTQGADLRDGTAHSARPPARRPAQQSQARRAGRWPAGGADARCRRAVQKHPNREVQERLSLVFELFGTRKSAARVLRALKEQELDLPRQSRFGDVVWRAPNQAGVCAILKNPAYAGADVYGRTRCAAGECGHLTSSPKTIPPPAARPPAASRRP
jgi:hypothetical protein